MRHYSFVINPLLGRGHGERGTRRVASGFLRIVTQQNFPNGPTPLNQALAVIDSLMAQPQANWVHPGGRHWEVFRMLCQKSRGAGKAVADAQHAAIAIEHAATWVSRDRDFHRFAALGLQFDEWAPEVL